MAKYVYQKPPLTVPFEDIGSVSHKDDRTQAVEEGATLLLPAPKSPSTAKPGASSPIRRARDDDGPLYDLRDPLSPGFCDFCEDPDPNCECVKYRQEHPKDYLC